MMKGIPVERDEPAAFDEIAIKARYWNSQTVNLRLHETFSADEASVAAVMLARLVGEDPNDPEGSDEATCRLMLAAIMVSQGDLTRLALWVDVAHADPRDLIAAAEYPLELQATDDAASLPAREADLATYLLWVSGGIPEDASDVGDDATRLN